MTGQPGWVFSRYSSDDAEHCLEFARAVGGDSELAVSAYQDWQWRRGPAGTAISALAREADAGRVIGQAVSVPIGVRLSGKLRTAGLFQNPLLDSRHEGGDLFAGLLTEVCSFSADQSIAFSYGILDQHFYSTLVNSAAFRDVGAIPLLIRPLNPERLALKATHNPVLGKAASVATKIWRTPRPTVRQGAPPGLEIAPVSSFDDPFVLFWDRVQHRFPVMVVREPAYLNWRFVDVPTREYVTFAARSEGQIRGFLVLRVASAGRFSAGLIADLLVETSAEGRAAGRLLLDQACSYSQDRDLDLVAGFALQHTDEFRLYRSRGFWVCPKFLQPQPYRLVVRCHDEEASPSRLTYDLRNWFLSMGDCYAA